MEDMQESQQTPNRINSKRWTPRHMIVKLSNSKTENLESSKGSNSFLQVILSKLIRNYVLRENSRMTYSTC